MKTLTGHILLYDKDCPLCCWYTNIFVKYKWLNEEGRMSYQDIDHKLYPEVDYDEARNKIALLNTEEHKISYGLDALRIMLSIPFPIVNIALKFKPFYWFMKQFYLFISMNRKVIIPVSCNRLGSCNPSRDWFWRIIFIVVCELAFGFGLITLPMSISLWPILLFVIGQFLVQYIACRVLREHNVYDYLGHLAMINCFSGMILLVLNTLHFLLPSSAVKQNIHWGAASLIIMLLFSLLEHRRRLRITEMKFGLTISLCVFMMGFFVVWMYTSNFFMIN